MGNLRKVIASISLVAVLSTFVVAQAAFAATTPFTDSGTGWFHTEGWDQKVKDAGIGTKDTFMPDKNVQRDELVKMAVVGADISVEDAEAIPTGVFTDIKAGDWVLPFLKAARQAEIVTEKPKFNPLDLSNRAQAAKVIVQAWGLTAASPATNVLPDLKLKYTGDQVWMNDIYTAYCYGIVKGKADGKYHPADNVTKAEFGKMLVSAMEAPELNDKCVEADTPADDDDDTANDDTANDDTANDDTAPDTTTGASGSVTASLSASSPSATTLASGTAFNPMLKVDFTAGSKAGKLTAFTITRSGLSQDSHLKVSVWDSKGKRHGSVVAFTDNAATVSFDSDPINIAAGATETVTFAVNISASLTTAATVGISLAKSADVTAGGTISGTFPVTGQTFGTVDGATSVAQAKLDVQNESSASRSVDIGTTSYELTKFKISESGSKEDMLFQGLTLFNNGSTADGDLTNFTLKDQNGEVVATATAQANKKIVLAFSDKYKDGYKIPKGTTRYFPLYIDVASGATRTAQVIVQNDYDLTIQGVSTKASILPIADTAGVDTTFPIGDLAATIPGYNLITLNEGTIAISKDNSSPSGDVTIGSPDVVLGSFKVTAQGEDLELQKIAVDLSGTAASATAGSFSSGALNATNTSNYFDCAAATSCDLTGSLKVVNAAGKTLVTITASTAALWNNTPLYVDLSAFSTIKAGQSDTISIVGTLNSSTTYLGAGEFMTAGINKIYYYKKSSLKYADSSSASANQVTAATSSLTVSTNSGFVNQTIVSGIAGVQLASFIVKAGSAEDVNVTSIGYNINETVVNTGSNINVNNIKFYKVAADGSKTQLGSTATTVTDSTATTLSISGLSIPKGGQIQIDAYGDTNSNLSTHTLTTTITAAGISGTGVISQSNPTGPATALPLQVITGSTGGSLTVTAATDNPLSDEYVAGTKDNSMLKVKLAASTAEDIYVKEVTVYNDTNADDAAFYELSLYQVDTAGTQTLVSTLGSQDNDTDPSYATWTLSGANRIKVPKSGSAYLLVKANLTTSQNNVNVTGKTPKLAIASIKAEGFNSITPAIIGAFADSTSVLLADNGSVVISDGATCTTTLNDTTTTTLTVGGCTVGNVPAMIPVGTLITLTDVAAEQMLVTASSSGSITVTRGQNSTLAAAHGAGAVNLKYAGKLAASSANKILPITAIENLAGVTCTGAASQGSCPEVIGQIVQVGAEQMYVYNATRSTTAAHDLLYVVRGVNGTTIAAAAGGVALNKLASPAMVAGNAMTVYNTKPSVAAAVDSPVGNAVAAGSNNVILAKFTVSAALNSKDESENSVTLNNLDLNFIKSNSTITSISMYPANQDNSSTFAISPVWLSGSSARFPIGIGTGATAGPGSNAGLGINSANATNWITSGYNKVIEGQSQTYVVRGTVASATSGTLNIKISALGTSSTTSLGAGNNGGDVDWIDGAYTGLGAVVSGTTNAFWVRQGTATTTVSEVALNSSALTFTAGGTHDSTGPTVSAVATFNKTGGTSGTFEGGCTTGPLPGVAAAPTTDSRLDVCDTLIIAFSEAVDPTSINASLIPGTLATGTTPATNAILGVASTATGGVTLTTGTNKMVVTNILAAFDYGTISATRAVSTNLALNASGTALQIFLNNIPTSNPTNGGSVTAGASVPVTTTVKDLNGNFLQATAVTPATSGSTVAPITEAAATATTL